MSVARCIEIAGRVFAADPHQIRSDRRAYALPRMAAYWLAFRKLPYSYKSIGWKFRRDPSTIRHGVMEIIRRRAMEPALWHLTEQMSRIYDGEGHTRLAVRGCLDLDGFEAPQHEEARRELYAGQRY